MRVVALALPSDAVANIRSISNDGPSTTGQPDPGTLRARIAALRADGLSYGKIAAQLGIAKSTVGWHAQRLGQPVDPRFSQRYDWTAIQLAHDDGLRAVECCRRFGCSRSSWDSAVRRGDIIQRPHLIPVEELFTKGRRSSRGHLKSRMLTAGLRESRCERCRIDDWLREPLSLHLHHINGDGTDNRLENLQLLCPNCHSQTDTYGGRNGHRRRRSGVNGA